MKNNHCLFTLLSNTYFGLYIIILIQSLIRVGFMFLLWSYVLRLALQLRWCSSSLLFLPDYTAAHFGLDLKILTLNLWTKLSFIHEAILKTDSIK